MPLTGWGHTFGGNVFAAGRTMPAARATEAAIGEACDPYRRVAGERDGLAKVSDLTAHTLHRLSLSAWVELLLASYGSTLKLSIIPLSWCSAM